MMLSRAVRALGGLGGGAPGILVVPWGLYPLFLLSSPFCHPSMIKLEPYKLQEGGNLEVGLRIPCQTESWGLAGGTAAPVLSPGFTVAVSHCHLSSPTSQEIGSGVGCKVLQHREGLQGGGEKGRDQRGGREKVGERGGQKLRAGKSASQQ